jgi:hypothetical protein
METQTLIIKVILVLINCYQNILLIWVLTQNKMNLKNQYRFSKNPADSDETNVPRQVKNVPTLPQPLLVLD